MQRVRRRRDTNQPLHGHHYDENEQIVIVEHPSGDAHIDYPSSLQALLRNLELEHASHSDGDSDDSDDSLLNGETQAQLAAARARAAADERRVQTVAALMADHSDEDGIVPDIFVPETKVPHAYRLRWMSSSDDDADSSDTDPSLGLSYTSDGEDGLPGHHHSHSQKHVAHSDNKACSVM